MGKQTLAQKQSLETRLTIVLQAQDRLAKVSNPTRRQVEYIGETLRTRTEETIQALERATQPTGIELPD